MQASRQCTLGKESAEFASNNKEHHGICHPDDQSLPFCSIVSRIDPGKPHTLKGRISDESIMPRPPHTWFTLRAVRHFGRDAFFLFPSVFCSNSLSSSASQLPRCVCQLSNPQGRGSLSSISSYCAVSRLLEQRATTTYSCCFCVVCPVRSGFLSWQY